MSLIMPKADGRIEPFLKSLKIYSEVYPNMLNNEEFKIKIHSEMGYNVPKDEPFLIKKSEIARYFGLVYYDFNLRIGKLTERGYRFLNSTSQREKYDLIMESILNDNFGRDNCASESSDSDLDPPRLLLKAILEFGGVTRQQFSRLIYLINDLNYNFDNIIEDFYTRNDTLPPLLENKYSDIKFLVFLKNIEMVVEEGHLLKLNPNYFDIEKIKKIEETSIYNTLSNFNDIPDEVKVEEKSIEIFNQDLLDSLNNRPPEITSNGIITKYKVNTRIKKTAIRLANYQCEHNPLHVTFLDKKGSQYMEGHHLIPMNAQPQTAVNLDRIENIVSLCPTCHRAVHYGDEGVKKRILWTLYQNNIQNLTSVNLNISFEDLLSYY